MPQRKHGRKTTSYPTINTPLRTSRFSQRLSSGFTWSDFFCGGGGSSTGLKGAGGDVVLASNHWELAIATHQTNHPDTAHYCEDLSAADPRRYPHTTAAWFSPECTWHSPAGGRARPTKQQVLWTEWEPEANETSERSRATMWDCVRFSEALGYKVVIVENVVEVLTWPLFDAWWRTMTESLGYEGEKVCLNSMFCWPTPQSRDRIYMVFWKKGVKKPDLHINPLAYCPTCNRNVNAIQAWKPNRAVGKYKRQYVYCCPTCANEVTPYYYAAANAIDWSQPIERIGDRKRALAPKTMERIRAGLEKYGRDPLLLVTNHRSDDRGIRRMMRDPWPTQLTDMRLGLAVPGHDGALLASPASFVLAGGEGGLPMSILDNALPTQTASGSTHLMVPWLIEMGHGGPENAGRMKAIHDATPTVHSLGGMGIALAPYFVSQSYADGHEARPAYEAFGTQSTRRDTGLLLAPHTAYSATLVDSGGVRESEPRPIHEPYPTQTSRRTPGVLMAPYLVIERAHADARGMHEPLATIATGNHHALALAPHPFLATYNGETGLPTSAIDDAMPTVTSVQRLGLGMPGQPDLPAVDDCYYRTLKAHEVKRAMGFPDSYVLLGDSRSQVHQAGNAVTPPAAQTLAQRVMEAVS